MLYTDLLGQVVINRTGISTTLIPIAVAPTVIQRTVFQPAFFEPLILQPFFARRAHGLRQAPRLCPAQVSYHVDHTHRLFITRDILSVAFSGYPSKFYKTTFDDGHSHVFELTFADVAALADGQTVTKNTVAASDPEGNSHTHYVRLSCVLSGSVPGTYGSPSSGGVY